MIVTTVSATGETEGKYDLATFSLVLTAEDALVPGVKLRLKTKIDELEDALKFIIDDLKVKLVKDSTRTNMNVQPKYHWDNNNNRVNDGFSGTYTLSFQVESMDKINQIYEALSNLHEVTLHSPSFQLKSVDRLNKKALKNAWKKVTERFADECEVLGLTPTDYEIESWEATYSDSKRPVAPAGARLAAARMVQDADEMVDDAIDITPGAAKVNVGLNVSFKKKG